MAANHKATGIIRKCILYYTSNNI